MRRVILQEFVTLDGLAAGPKDSVEYVPASMKGDERFDRETQTGRKKEMKGVHLSSFWADCRRRARTLNLFV